MKTRSDRSYLPQRLQLRRILLAVVLPAFAAFGAALILGSQADRPALAQAPAQAQAKPPDKAISGAATNAEPSKKPRATDHAIVAALHWLAKHQSHDGNWSLQKYTEQCTDKTCTGTANQESYSAATALGLLPFLRARQSQANSGPFQKTIASGIQWLVNHQKADDDLSAGAESQMYSHGLATIALCEDYGVTHDIAIGKAAQKAINFIQAAQNSKTGGWRYHPGDDGDTSVFGWQFMALKSAQFAGLAMKPTTFDGAKKWLQSCSAGGADIGKFSYQPGDAPTPTMSAVALLSNQGLNLGKTDPVVIGGVTYLMANQPDLANRNIYYWFYATEAIHNTYDKDWDTWSRVIRRTLIDTQIQEGCAAGSWDPEKPSKDAWGPSGGRLMATGLSCLTLDTYYRKIWLYQLDKDQQPSDDHTKK